MNTRMRLLIIIIIMIYCPKWKIRNGKSFLEILFAQLIVGPAATEQRQVDVALSLSMLSAKQGSSNSHLLTSFGMTRPGIEPTTSRLWGGRSTDWANTHRSEWQSQRLYACFHLFELSVTNSNRNWTIIIVWRIYFSEEIKKLEALWCNTTIIRVRNDSSAWRANWHAI